VVDPREIALQLEAEAQLPERPEESAVGYGVMGLPFASGHILALRRFPATSIGEGFTSVWHRTPDGRWSFAQDAEREAACTRYFGAALVADHRSEIEIEWTGSHAMHLTMDEPRLASAVLEGEDLGPLGPVPRQGRLGDLYIPQRGLLATGGALVEPFDADRHIAADVRVSA